MILFCAALKLGGSAATGAGNGRRRIPDCRVGAICAERIRTLFPLARMARSAPHEARLSVGSGATGKGSTILVTPR